MLGLALTKFLDCNTRHVECSIYVPGLGTHKSTNTTATTTTVKHAEVETMTDKTQTVGRITSFI